VGAIGAGEFLLYIKYLAGTVVPSGCERKFREGHADTQTFHTSKKNLLMFPVSI
jgi:hypothetical protein